MIILLLERTLAAGTATTAAANLANLKEQRNDEGFRSGRMCSLPAGPLE